MRVYSYFLPLLLPLVFGQDVDNLCPEDFFALEGVGCYHLSTETMSWIEAYYYCEEMAATLVMLQMLQC